MSGLTLYSATDDNMVTAKGQAFVELSLKLNEVMNMYKSEEERLEDRKWWLGETQSLKMDICPGHAPNAVRLF